MPDAIEAPSGENSLSGLPFQLEGQKPTRRLGHLDGPPDIGDGLALSHQLLGASELADYLLRSAADLFHAGDPIPV